MSMVPATLAGFRTEAPLASTLIELNAAFRRYARHFGFTAYAVGFIPGQGETSDPFLLLDWPRHWLELYAREGFAREDALLARAATSDKPFTWIELQSEQPGASARIFAAARGFGWLDGLLVPIRGHRAGEGCRVGVASLASAKPLDPDARRRDELIEASTIAFHRAVELAKAKGPTMLTDREREVVALIASGKGDREIGVMLGISTATAHFHVEQAKKKLGVATRARAVAVAVTEGLVR